MIHPGDLAVRIVNDLQVMLAWLDDSPHRIEEIRNVLDSAAKGAGSDPDRAVYVAMREAASARLQAARLRSAR